MTDDRPALSAEPDPAAGTYVGQPPPAPRPEALPDDLASLDDDDLDRAILGHERQRERLRERSRPYRADAHQGIDAMVAAAEAAIDAALSSDLLSLASPAQREARGLPDIGSAWVIANDPSIRERWHAAVDRSSPELWATYDRAEHNAMLGLLDLGLARLKAEQGRRRRAIERARLDAEAEADGAP